MGGAATEPYPGESATPEQIRLLADEYRAAAHHLRPLGRRRKPLSRAPFRLSALQAIELYLNAYLLHHGHAPDCVRGLQHDLEARARLAKASGLELKLRTTAHLAVLGEKREYLVTRYGPELATSWSPVNRLVATLDEVAGKVAKGLAAR